jgi:hypothetical protein
MDNSVIEIYNLFYFKKMEADIFISVRAALIQQTHALPPNEKENSNRSMTL